MLEFGDIRMDLLQRTATRGRRVLDLLPTEWRLLEFMLRHPAVVLTRTMLLESVGDLHFDPQTNVVESHISRLRAKVDRPFGSELIRTVRGAGYRIDA